MATRLLSPPPYPPPPVPGAPRRRAPTPPPPFFPLQKCSTQQSSSWPELRTGPIVTGAALVGAGALIALAGFAVGGSHLFSATRRWIREMKSRPASRRG